MHFDVLPALGLRRRRGALSFVPSEIWHRLDEFIGRPMAMRSYLQDCVGVNLAFKPAERDPKVHRPTLSGEYDPTKNRATVFIHSKFSEFASFPFTHDSWNQVKFDIIELALHEFVHMSQWKGDQRMWRSRNVRHEPARSEIKHNERGYLSHPIEIDAYALSVLLEMMSSYRSFDSKTLASKLNHKIRSETARYYLSTFGYKDAMDKLVVKKLVHRAQYWDRRIRKHAKQLGHEWPAPH